MGTEWVDQMGVHDVGLQVDRMCLVMPVLSAPQAETVCTSVLVSVRSIRSSVWQVVDARMESRGKVGGAPNRSAGAIAWTPVAL